MSTEENIPHRADAGAASDPADRPAAGEVPGPGLVPVRRSRGVRFLPWLATGGLLGLLAGAVIALRGEHDARYTAASQLGYVAFIGMLIGLAVAGAIAAALDVFLLRRR